MELLRITTNTLQGRRAKSHVDTQIGTSGTGGLRTLDPLPPCYKILAAPLVWSEVQVVRMWSS